MAHRSLARWIAPLALLTALIAVGLIVTSARDGGESPASSQPASGGQESSSANDGATENGTGAETETTAEEGVRTYTVKAGDTLGTIAEETGVSVEQLVELNPEVDPQSLRVGQRLRLR